jgi:hypothetical protein
MRVNTFKADLCGGPLLAFCSRLIRTSSEGSTSDAARGLRGSSRVRTAARAGLMLMAGFALTLAARAQVVLLTPAYPFAQANVGAAVESGMAVVPISVAGNLSAINVVTQGVPNQARWFYWRATAACWEVSC